jgi:hypothetical protein
MLDETDIVQIVDVVRQLSFARVDTNKRAIAARRWGPLNYILIDHPELEKTKDRVHSINKIYMKQVRDGVDIIDLNLLNTEKGAMGMCMEMFIYHRVKENALGKLSATEKRRATGNQDYRRRQEALKFMLASWTSPADTPLVQSA